MLADGPVEESPAFDQPRDVLLDDGKHVVDSVANRRVGFGDVDVQGIGPIRKTADGIVLVDSGSPCPLLEKRSRGAIRPKVLVRFGRTPVAAKNLIDSSVVDT